MDTNTINYAQYCAYRLPCGICQRTNAVCPLSANTITTNEPPMVAVYAAPVRYPYNYGEVYEYRNRWRDPEARFDFPRKADLVTIQISANDHKFSKEELYAAAKDLFKTIRSYNGDDVKILLIVANNRYAHLLELGRELAAEDPNVYVAEYKSIRDGMGKHSSANSHIIKSGEILKVVRPLF